MAANQSSNPSGNQSGDKKRLCPDCETENPADAKKCMKVECAFPFESDGTWETFRRYRIAESKQAARDKAEEDRKVEDEKREKRKRGGLF
jgi:hypothetical protein